MIPTQPASSYGPFRVLVVEDHQAMRQAILQVLARLPDIMIVGEAADGIQAIAMTKQLAPFVVLMDVSLPGVDGIEATRRIKSEAPGVHVIGISMDVETSQSQMKAAGAACTISKTGLLHELMPKVQGLISP